MILIFFAVKLQLNSKKQKSQPNTKVKKEGGETMLYTGKQIAEQYSTEEVEITESTIRRWANNGLKHIKGKNGKFLYKKEWVEDYIEIEAEREMNLQTLEEITPKKIPKTKNKLIKFDISNTKVV